MTTGRMFICPACRSTILGLVVLLLAAIPAQAEPPKLFLGGSGSTVFVAAGNRVYRASGVDQMETLVDVGRRITAMTAGADGIFVAAGRSIWCSGIDGNNLRPLTRMRGDVTALANFGGQLYVASGDTLYLLPAQSEETPSPPSVHARVPGDIRSLYVAPDGVYVAEGRNLWRVRGSQRDKILRAAEPILSVAGGNRNIYYACRAGRNVEIRAPESTRSWKIEGLRNIDGLYFEAERSVFHYAWFSARAIRFQTLPLAAP